MGRAVREAQAFYTLAKRTGQMGKLTCSIQPSVADSIEKLTLIEFANYTGMFTYRRTT